MRISVIHSTAYHYDAPVVLEPHILRLRPREDGTQRLIRFETQITPPPQGQSVGLDPYGNVAVQAWFAGPHSGLSIRSAFEVETLRQNPFDFLLPAANVLALPISYSAAERTALAPYLADGGQAAEFAHTIAASAAGQTMPFLDGLVRDLFQNSRHIFRRDGPPLSPAETLRQRSGSCRDLTVLFCAACRAVGIAARFVSGYETQSAFHEHSYMHAWPEVYIPGGGWRGYDPSRGISVSTAHVPVAAAPEAAEAAPVSGKYRGSARSTMEFSIAMQAAG